MSDFMKNKPLPPSETFLKRSKSCGRWTFKMLEPDKYYLYEDTLQEAYDALTTVEDAVTTLGMKLEYQHWRLGGAVDELRPLIIQPRSNIDRVLEAMNERMRHLDIQFDSA